MDDEVVDFLKSAKEELGLTSSDIKQGKVHTIRFSNKKGKKVPNDFMNIVKEYGMVDEQKRIHPIYKTSSRDSRLQLLAGLVDTDGYYHHGHYEITTKFDLLKEDILFLARSLGFAAYAHVKMSRHRKDAPLKPYWRITISGDFHELPCRIERKKPEIRRQKKSVLRTGFQIVEEGIGDYYGFMVDGDHMFLLGDFTVAHNSMLTVHMIRQAIEQEKHIYIACVEDRKVSVLRRVYAALTGIPITDIKRLCDMTPTNRAKMTEASKKLEKFVSIEFMYGVPLDFILSRIKEQTSIRRLRGLPDIEIVGIDYLQHIAHLSTGDSMHEKLTLSMAKFKDFVLANNLVGFTHQQVNRGGVASQNKDGLITLAEMSASFQAAFVADVIISINRTPDMRERDEAVLYVCKGREGSVEQKYQIKTEFHCARYNMSDYVRIDKMG
jgi:hypothetical protein